jgi:hypothetical protein
MKCWNISAFHAQGSRLIIVVVQLGGAVKIYVAAVDSLRKKENIGWWNSVYHENWWFSEFHPSLNASVLSSLAEC